MDDKNIQYVIQYVIMIKGEPEGYKQAADENKTVIKNNARHLVKKTHLYAAQKEVQLFKD